ncbi:hypothetical protein ACFORH_31000 [Amycolatopsis roodepoortensis]|uniref:DUF8017 domain-containing protein n=1 Tax=Amycolatopsis roodepoortensis TaxID=700274 RepID=A0ABR9KXN1_9PSEU|nr:hypothetical protein [Amycolatopsis roodepoortensis]MBE1573129.1 hypothetical protein [Amycolatopsis roodepoortensis]
MFGKKRRDSPGYEDNAALDGFGGYQPSDSSGYTPAPETPAPEPEPEPEKPAKQPMSRSGRRAMYGFFATIGVITVAALANNSDRSDSSGPTTRAPVVYTPSPRVVAPPVTEGWQSVAGKDGVYAYDVPPNWIPKPGTIHGWEKGTQVPGITMVASAFVGEGYCPQEKGSRVGGAGVANIKVSDPAAAAKKAVDDLAVSAYNPENGPLTAKITPEPPQPAEFTLGTGKKVPASIVFAEVVTPPGPCGVQRALVGVLAPELGDASAALAVYSGQGAPGGADRELILKILKTYRGVPEADRKTITPPPSTLR